MTSGLHAPLTVEEEVLLRRVAHGSQGIDPRKLGRLCSLALVERIGGGWRLTPLGQHRFDSLPKALVFQKHKLPLRQAVEATLEKYRRHAPVKAKATTEAKDMPPPPPMPITLDPAEWKLRAENHLIALRDQMSDHRRRQIALIDGSELRIAESRRLLRATVPRLVADTLPSSTAANGSFL